VKSLHSQDRVLTGARGLPPPAASARLRVQGPSGRTERLEFPGATEDEALRQAAARGYRVLAIEAGANTTTVPAARATGPFPLLLFSQELLALIDAGLNLTEALVTLQSKERHAHTRDVIGELLRTVREGRSFSDALAGAPEHFPNVYIATVRASERTGDLPRALQRFIAYQVQFDTIRKKLVGAAIYPAMLLTVGGFVTLFLLGYVVPRFSAVYESSGREMPWLSSMLLVFGKAIYDHWQVAAVLVLAALGGIGGILASHRGRAVLVSQVLRTPWLARRVEEFRLARFYRAVSLLLASGIALPRAMGMVTGLLSAGQQLQLAGSRLAVEQGQSLSSALLAGGLISPVAESLIKVGERSGQLAEMLERTARFHDEDFGRWVEWASKLLEPVLMAIIGLVIGTVVVLMYMPIFELAGSLQ
jgi:general secretion pathway protein F